MSVPVNSVAPAYSQVGGVYPSPSASGFGSALGSGAVSASAPGAASASGAPSAAPFGPKPGYTRVPIPGSASSGLVSTTKSAFTSVSQDVSVGEPSASASTSSLTPQTGAGSVSLLIQIVLVVSDTVSTACYLLRHVSLWRWCSWTGPRVLIEHRTFNSRSHHLFRNKVSLFASMASPARILDATDICFAWWFWKSCLPPTLP